MLPKKSRADKGAVENVFKGGKFINTPILSFKFLLKRVPSPAKVSFIVPKSVAKGAVVRNSLRRLGYQALQKHLTNLPAGLLGVFLFKKPENSIQEVETNVANIISKIN